MSGIILNSRAKTRLPEHLYIKIRPLGDSLRLQKLVLALKILYTLFKLRTDSLNSRLHRCGIHHIMRGRIDISMFQYIFDLSCHDIDLRDSINLVSKKLHTNRRITGRGQENLQHIPSHPKGRPLKVHIVPCILYLN